MDISFSPEAQQFSFLTDSKDLPFDLDRINSLVNEHMLLKFII